MLMEAEEKELAQWISDLTATGHPARHGFICKMAEVIRKQRHTSSKPKSYRPLGIARVQQFMKRHPHLQTTMSCLIESVHIKEVSKRSIEQFFTIFCEKLEERQITVENVYNMDETGTSLCYYS
jgi:Tc5 transposase DNA-binding domain